jgi:hypothetical protein
VNRKQSSFHTANLFALQHSVAAAEAADMAGVEEETREDEVMLSA